MPARVMAILAALALGMSLHAPAAPAQESSTRAETERVAGASRVDTAANISAATFETAETAHVVTAEEFSDALAASYGGGAVEGPILLVGQDNVPQPTWDELERLETERVVIVGGEEAVSAAVQSQLTAHGYDTERVSGADRYQTASAVGLRYGAGPDGEVGTLDGDRTALLANGEAFADALAAGPLAAGATLPLLLTPPDEPHASVDATLTQLDIERVVIVGGTAAVSTDVADHYADAGYTVERWAGASRTDTAAVVATNAVARAGFSAERVLVTRGDDYPDALTASVHAGQLGAPVLLTADPATLGSATGRWLVDRCGSVGLIRGVGGFVALAATTLSEAASAANVCLHEPMNQDYIVSPQQIVSADIGGEADFELLDPPDQQVDAAEMALFPCEVVDFSTSRIRFTDRGDGSAAGAGDTDRDKAWISHINGHPQGTTEQDRDRAVQPGQEWTLTSEGLDCAVVVVWGPGSENELELPVDEDGEPTVNFGIGVVEFR